MYSTKPLLLLFLTILLMPLAASAQKRPLTNSRQSSYYTYIYKLSDADVETLYKYPDKDLDERILKRPIDSVRTDSYWENTLPPGNYMNVQAKEDKLSYELIENHSANIVLLNNRYEHRFTFIDKQGKYVTKATVTMDGKPISYDAQSQTWWFKKFSKQHILKAQYNGVSNYFIIKDSDYNPDYDDEKPSWLSRTWHSLTRIFTKKSGYNRSQYSGFMVFNKPQYKPLDTVKFKAFILKDKVPLKLKTLSVTIDNNSKDGLHVGNVNSYRDGGFEYSFVLADSLKLDLDRNYYISLNDPAEKTGTDRYSRQLMSASFRYEDYELKSTNFTIRADKKELTPWDPAALYLKAVDENDLPVADGRVKINLVTQAPTGQYAPGVTFIKDTLWQHTVKLDPVGETKVVIPDSIFPRVSLNYQVEAEFFNSNNESRNSSLFMTYLYESGRVVADLKADSLKATLYHKGKVKPVTAYITAYRDEDEDDTLSRVKVTLPVALPVNGNVSSYNIETDSTDTDVKLSDYTDDIALNGEKTRDSLMVNVANPRNLPLFYTVFEGTRVMETGKAVQLNYRRAYTKDKAIIFAISYTWGGKTKSQRLALVYRRDLLTISVKQPLTVSPGQRINTDIVVTDVEGKPVANTDVTAWANTKKFTNVTLPRLPNLVKPYRSRVFLNDIVLDDDADPGLGSQQLDWQRWRGQMGLDTIEYYKFTHPNTTYRIAEPGIDTVTQVAPFLVKDGNVLPVHILYIDKVPVYFSQAQHYQPYSFKVSPGKHSIQMRTAKYQFNADSIEVPANKKLIISFEATLNKATPMPDTLNTYEARLINQYLVTIVNNFQGQRTTLTQNDHLYPLNARGIAANSTLVGPLAFVDSYIEQGDNIRSFMAEPGYSYLFEPGLIKQKSVVGYPFKTRLSVVDKTPAYSEYALTRHRADSLWNDYIEERNRTSTNFNNPFPADGYVGRLHIQRQESGAKVERVQHIILYKYDDPDFLHVNSGNTVDLGRLRPGRYRALYLFTKERYTILENLQVKPYALSVYQLDLQPTHARDSLSIKLTKVINSRTQQDKTRDYLDRDANRLKEVFNDRYLDKQSFKNVMTGTVVAREDGLPIPGAMITISGTTIGTQTNLQGRFSLQVPSYGKLIIRFLGSQSQEVNIQPGRHVNVVLAADTRQLNEVVVTARGLSVHSRAQGFASTTVTGSVLAGKVAGVEVVQSAGGVRLVLRGNRSLPGQQPLYVIDGKIVKGMNSIDPVDIADIQVLKDAAATALYGSEAANGVVIITTKAKSNDKMVEPAAAEQATAGLRSKFSDYAYWQPKLLTDENGKVSFSSVVPDDVTSWRTFVVGINGNRQAGSAEGQIKSFKPVSANFIAPQFAVEGDQMNLIGKVMNYTSDTLTPNRTFSYNGKVIKQGNITVTNAKIDTLAIIASATDSLAFEYSIKRDNGYVDGEQRKVPVFKRGVQETKGMFAAMDGDTTFTWNPDPKLGAVTLRAEASLLPILTEETERLRNYQYLCNEQLASKLKGLLVEKRIAKLRDEPFKYDKNVKDILKKLQNARRTSGGWGWWKDSDEELWISLHAIEALVDARASGYNVQLDATKLIDYLVYQLESYNGRDKITSLQLLNTLKAKVDQQKYINAITADIKKQKTVSEYDKMRLLLLSQSAGLKVNVDSLIKKHRSTMFGNIYWGEDNYNFFDNSTQITLMAYKIIKAEGKHPQLLGKIRGYLLEQRKGGEWRNTYESAQILETILSDILNESKQIKPASVVINGGTAISTFPYNTTLTDKSITVSKKGALPIYVTGYQQFWNASPEKTNKDFTVDTHFERNGSKLTQLKGGEVVALTAEVTARADGDYVMINIPIPAGCSYDDKNQSWENNEVHREFFKDRISIFCRKLKQGKYTFSVKLMPRYSGSYTLNPAKAELMYFPVFYGREGMKTVKVAD